MTAHTIMIAEDDPGFRRELGMFFQKLGYRVVLAEDGYQALEVALHESPDIMLLDVHMPAGDGFSVHERVARHPELALTPVVYMTHEHTDEVEDAAERHGAHALLYKPFNLDYLLQAVRTAIRISKPDAA